MPLALQAAAPCTDGLAALSCARHVDNKAGKRPRRPAPGKAVEFAALGTRVTRITRPALFGDGSIRQRHQYSRRQAWNADETLLDLGGGLLDAEDYSVVLARLPISTERNWSNQEAHLIYGIRYNPAPTEFGVFDVRSGEFDTIERFDAFASCTLGEGEGNLSNDDRLVVFVCADEAGGRMMIAYDIEARKELGRRAARSDLNWVSFTQSGRYIVLENNDPQGSANEEIVRFEPDFSGRKQLTEDRSHGDLGIDQQGNDVLVMIDWKRLSYLEIASGERVRLSIADRFNPVGHGHVSCRNIGRPGWCYLSSYDGAIGAFRLGASATLWDSAKHWLMRESDSRAGAAAFEPWGYHHSTSDSYEAEPKASVSPSGRRVIFSSDWGGKQLNEFVIEPVSESK